MDNNNCKLKVLYIYIYRSSGVKTGISFATDEGSLAVGTRNRIL